MKYLKYYKYILGIAVAFSTASCNEDSFLNVEPKGKLSSDTYLETEAEVKTVVVGVYNSMQENYSSGAWASVYFIKNLPADDCLAGSTEGDQADYQYIDDFAIQTTNAKLEGIWTNFYKAISSANTVINLVEPSTDGRKALIAEAKALRAYNYLELVTLFGGVPLMTVNPVDPSEYHLPRAGADEVYAQIEKDFSEAIVDLPLKSEYSSADKYRFSKGTAQAYYGKALLYQKKYAEAAIQLAAVISSSEYDLEPNFADVWTQGTEFGQESLFEMSYTSQELYDWGSFPWDGTNESNIEAQLQGPRGDIFDVSGSSLNIVNGWGFNAPSAKIAQAFIDAGDTERKNATLISADDFFATGGKYAEKYNGDAHDYEGFMRLKYATKAAETAAAPATAELNYTINWRLMRYADVLLMAAEAYHFSDQPGLALIELNKVRERAGLSDLTEVVFEAIVTERQLELAFEGSRYWDLVRWGLASQELGSLGYQTGKHELFPIPQNEIIANNAIAETDQNPGY
ncbi:RagB/SusD family nutrient uptake outer membrane protein [Ancylomarina sp. 16SWW S1-10-2]|uniref:RagB/SusD family nutrient uptake outer membrane protein n=1 Tax=Ancylomarina sp. 16SWW S1-10-2 TaxID=2499681 RepID=UPI0012ADA7E5|nr:RagB/SusD family nutrient uptake outer membrane protein [Ancylomarina sp. 16SWW S1-10-2]MRT93971.1 RagB/SusD family nutrient uptake outer membrane protein [Ancylomarina sp. 16SWW S1-10-2]